MENNTVGSTTSTPPTNSATDQPSTVSVRYAGFWIRVIAGLIDAVVISIITYIIQMLIGESNPVSIIIGAAYHIGMWLKNDGMTIGKKIMGIKVIQTNGQPIDAKTAAVRYIGYMISGFVFAIGFIWVAFDKNKQGWHDKIANTYVIYK